jgi:hypothetical protein
MEFEKDAPVSDDERRLAEVKKITLQPAHTDIVPEDVSASEIASSHINGQPIDTIHPIVKQDTSSPSSVNKADSTDKIVTHKQSIMMIAIIVGIAIALIIASLIFTFTIINSI